MDGVSANRLRSGNEPGVDCPFEITFTEFLTRAHTSPILRVQGKITDATKAKGRLVRFNRSVQVLPETAAINASGNPYVTAQRIRWNWRRQRFDLVFRKDGTPWMHTLTWSQLDYVTWQACGDPNNTWIKVL